MKMHLFFIGLFSLVASGFCTEIKESNIERLKKNPGIRLNRQDVPIFYEGHPLKGLNIFTVLSLNEVQNKEIGKKIESLIKRELGSLGSVIKVKNKNIIGFASGNLLNIQIGQIANWDGKELPVYRVTLSIETRVRIKNSNVNSLPRVWSINDFLHMPTENASEEMIMDPIQKLLGEFIKNYRFVNQDCSKKPKFYVYF